MDQNNQHNNNGAAGGSFFSNIFRGILPHGSLSDQNNADRSIAIVAHSEVVDAANHLQAPTDIVMSDDEPIPDLIAHPSTAPDAPQVSPGHNVDSTPPMRAEYAQNYNIPPPATVDHDDARSDSSMPDLQSVSDSSDDADAQSERDAYDVEMHLVAADDGDSAWTDESMPPLEPAVPDQGTQRRHVGLEEVPDPDGVNAVPAPIPANPQSQPQQSQPHLHLPPNIRPIVPPFLHLPRPQNGGQTQGQRQAQPQSLPPFATLMADLTQSLADGQGNQGQGQGQQQAYAPAHHVHPHFPLPPFPQPPQQAGDQPGNQNQQGNAPPHGHFHFHDGPNGGMLALSFDMTIIPVAPPSTANESDARSAPAQGEAQPERQTQGQDLPASNPNLQQPRPGNVNVQDTGAERVQWNGTSFTDVLNMFGMLGMPVTAPEGGEAPDIVRAIMQTLMAFGGAGLEPDRDDPVRARKLIRGLEVVPEGLVKRMERLAKEEGDTGGMGAGCAVCWEPLLEEVTGSGWEENKHDGDGDIVMEGVQDAAAPAGHPTPIVQEPSSTAAPHDQPTTTTPAGTPPPQAGAGPALTADSADEEPLPPIVALPCSHVFHSACLVPWFARPHQTTCPTCRFDIDPEGLTQNAPRRPMPMPTAQEDRRARMQERAQWRTTFGAGAMPMPGRAATPQQAAAEPALASQPQFQQAQSQPQQPQTDTVQQPQMPQSPRSSPRADAQVTFVPLNFAGGPGSGFWEMSGIMPVIAMPPGTRIPHLHHHHPQSQQHAHVTALNRAQTASRALPQSWQQVQAAGQPAGQQPHQFQAPILQHEGQQQSAPQSPSAPATQPAAPLPAQAQPQPQMPQATPRHPPLPHYQAQPFVFPPFRFGVPPPAPGLAPAPTNAAPRRKPTWTVPPAPGSTLRQRIEQRERDAALRCDDVSCGIGPSDEDPMPELPPGAKEMVFIRPPHADGRVCAHRFHAACLVVSERVAGWGQEDQGLDEARAEVEVGCPVCRAVGVVSREEWQEGARAAV